MSPLTLRLVAWGVGLAAVAAALWFAYAWAYGRGVRSMEAQVASAKAQAAEVRAANAANVLTVNALQAQLDACTSSIAAHKAEAERAAEQVAAAEADRIRIERRYEANVAALGRTNPSVSTWLRTPIPDALAPALRH